MKKIKRIEKIIELADQKKSIFCMNWKKNIPAAFIQNWSGRMLFNFIKQGLFFEYKPKQEKPHVTD